MTGADLSAIDRAVREIYTPSIIARGRHFASIATVLGLPEFPPEPTDLDDYELALWYLDMMGA